MEHHRKQLKIMAILQSFLNLCLIVIPTRAQYKAYDCSTTNNIRKLSIPNTTKCAELNGYVLQSQKYQQFTVIKIPEIRSVPGLICKIQIRLKVAKCKEKERDFSWKYVNGQPKTQLKRTKSDCLKAISTKTIMIHNKELASIIEHVDGSDKMILIENPNHTNGSIMMKGAMLTNQNKCLPSRFQIQGIVYKSHMLKLEYTIEIYHKQLPLNTSDGNLYLTKELSTKRIREGAAFDTKEGNFFWNPLQNPKCLHSKVFEQNIGMLIKNKDYNKNNPTGIIALNTSSIKGTINLFHKVQSCNGRDLFLTKEKNIIIELNTDKNVTLKSTKRYMSQLISTVIEKKYFHIASNTLCEMKQQQEPKHLPGELSIKRGIINYQISCVKIKINIRFTRNCFQDLPIKYTNNQGKEEYGFLNAHNFVIKLRSRLTECSNDLPLVYSIQKDNNKLQLICRNKTMLYKCKIDENTTKEILSQRNVKVKDLSTDAEQECQICIPVLFCIALSIGMLSLNLVVTFIMNNIRNRKNLKASKKHEIKGLIKEIEKEEFIEAMFSSSNKVL